VNRPITRARIWNRTGIGDAAADWRGRYCNPAGKQPADRSACLIVDAAGNGTSPPNPNPCPLAADGAAVDDAADAPARCYVDAGTRW